MNIGLDFGTTNSILSYYNRNTDYIETYRLNGNAGNNYIPSVVAIEDNEIIIGDAAKNLLNDEYIDVYTRFKIFLNIKDKNLLKEKGFKNYTPKEITKIYLSQLINNFIKDKGLKKIDSLVLTVPEIWFRNDYESRTILKNIISEIGLPLKKFVSEPVAAGAYFLYNYEKIRKEKFNGHLLIFDYGGGTLDISLLSSKDNNIKILERTGIGKDKLFSGKAGVAFDEKVIRTMCQDKISKVGKNYYSLLNDFERQKIQTSSRHEKFILNYLNKNENKRIFKLTCLDNNDMPIGVGEITASNLVKAFEDLKKDIQKSLKEIYNTFYLHNVDVNDSDKFRVIMVGGFSNFYLSKKSVKEFFNASDDDRRFQTYFETEDIALAISKGATLIAEDIINIDETYPVNIDLLVYNQNLEEQFIRVFQKGDIVSNHKVKYINKKIAKAGKITLKISENENLFFKIKINKEISQIYPNFNRNGNKWQIGFSIDNNSFIYIHLKDIYGNEKKTELGDIIRKYKEALIIEE